MLTKRRSRSSAFQTRFGTRCINHEMDLATMENGMICLDLSRAVAATVAESLRSAAPFSTSSPCLELLMEEKRSSSG